MVGPAPSFLHVVIISADNIPERQGYFGKYTEAKVYVALSFRGERKHTTAQAQVGATAEWGQELVWDLSGREVGAESIAVQVYWESHLRDQLVGAVAVAVSGSSDKPDEKLWRLDPSASLSQGAAALVLLRCWVSASPAPGPCVEATTSDRKQHEPPEVSNISPELQLDNIALGMYKINVQILEGRGLRARSAARVCSPSVSVEIDGGQKYHTKCVRGSGEHAVWYETFSFDMELRDCFDIRRIKLRLHCHDENLIVGRHLIGSFDLELGYIFFQPNHEMFRKWLALFNFDDVEKKGIQGLLLVSASVLGPGDKMPMHNDNDILVQSDTDIDGSDLGVIVSPSVERTGALVELKVYRAERLPQMDFTIASALGGQGIDAYVQLRFGDSEFCAKTSIVKNRSPTFNEIIYCPVVLPSFSDTIEVRVMDYDFFDADDCISTLNFSLKEIQNEPDRFSHAQWWNLYGAPTCCDAWPAIQGPAGRLQRRAEAMNRGQGAATCWRGRILMSLRVAYCPLRELSCRTEAVSILPLLGPAGAPDGEPLFAHYGLVIKLFEASCLSIADKLHIEVSVSGLTLCNSAEHVPINGNVMWSEVLYGDFDVPMHARDGTKVELNTCADIFINVRDNKHRLGYVRLPLKSLMTTDCRPEWHLAKFDIFEGYSGDGHMLGMILFEARAGPQSEIQQAAQVARQTITTTPRARYRLLVHLYFAANIYGPNDGTNPYVVLSCCGQKIKTKEVTESQNPAWYAVFEMDFVASANRSLIAPILIQIFHHNQIMSDELLYFCTIAADSIPGNSAPRPVPTWYELSCFESGAALKPTESGVAPRVLVALHLIELHWLSCESCGAFSREPTQYCLCCGASFPPQCDPASILLHSLPEMIVCTVEFAVFALRDLVPAGILPMTSPYVSASIASNTSTCRSSDRPSPSSPNLLQTIVFRSVAVPNNSTFAPCISVHANDRRFAASIFLGSTCVSLAEYLPWISPEARIAARKTRHDIEAKAGWREPSLQPPSIAAHTSGPVQPPAASGNRGANVYVCIGGERIVVDQTVLHEEDGDTALADYMKDRLCLGGPMEGLLVADDQIDPVGSNAGFATYYLLRHIRSNLFGKSVLQYSGYLKAKVRVTVGDQGQPLEPLLQSPVKSQSYLVRLYVLDAEGLASTDFNGSSNPYLRVSLGSKAVSDRSLAKPRCLNPVFHQRFEFHTELPGVSALKIDVMNANIFISDDLIGSTVIDLEERVFSPTWIKTGQRDGGQEPLRPVEQRSLGLGGSREARGTLKLWVDIMSLQEAARFPAWDIALQPERFVLRVIIWRIQGARSMDPLTNQNDLFVAGRLVAVDVNGRASSEQRQTDTHWRSKGGRGSFNWRWNFPLTLPLKDLELTIQAWDQDVIGSNDLVGESTISLKALTRRALSAHRAGRKETFRFPSGRVMTVALQQQQRARMNKRDARLIRHVKNLLGRGHGAQEIADKLKDEEAAKGGRRSWTAESVMEISKQGEQGEPAGSTGFVRSFLRRARGMCAWLSKVASRGSRLSPNATVWVPLHCNPDEWSGTGNETSCTGCCCSWCMYGSEQQEGDAQLTGASDAHPCGWVELEAELLPESLAAEHPSGEGREDPNANPVLPAPQRVQFGELWFRPDLLLYELLGPDLCCKAVLLALIVALVVGLVQTLPLILTNVYTSAQIEAKLP